MRLLQSAHLYAQQSFFSQVLKDWEMRLRVVEDDFFLSSQKSWNGRVVWMLLEML
jgi:hypothetical protein